MSESRSDTAARASDQELVGRIALVTGAGRGIGAATAAALAGRGAAVAVVARGADAVAAVADGLRANGGTAFALPADLGDPDALEEIVPAVIAELGGLDILVNNAGLLPEATRSERVTRAEWERVFAVNLTAPWLLASRAHDVMASRGGGVVINVTSTASSYPSVGLAHYCSSKAGLEMTTKALALEWARDRIRVIGLAPGRVDTDMVRAIIEFDERRGARPNPLDRLGKPDEIADVIAFLCSDRAGFITGTTLVVDGGELIGLATAT